MEQIRKQDEKSASSQRTAQAKFTSKSREGAPANGIDDSPLMVAQRKKLQSLFGSAVQRQVAEEEMLQGKLDAAQRVEDEEPLQGKFARESAVQLKEEPAAKSNNTGLPDNLKSGIESLSGMPMDNVKVHYNSSQPAQLNALAYAQGTDIHVAPGQEQHLPHEAWHVVQQAQGRVKPTMQMKDGVPVNDDAGLEHEADAMGARALSAGVVQAEKKSIRSGPMDSNVVQRVVYPTMAAMWAIVHPGYALANVQQDSVLAGLYNDAAAQLPNCDFVQVGGMAPQATATPLAAQPFRIDWDTAANLGLDNDYFASAIIHELAHAASAQQYRQQGANVGMNVFMNLNMPAPIGVVSPVTGMTPNQLVSYQNQMQTIDNNWTDLEAEANADSNAGTLGVVDYNHIYGRIQYALATAFAHNDTVLGDMMYYLKAKNLDNSRTYKFARRMLKEANDRRQNGYWSNADTEARRVDSRARWFQFWKW